MGVIERTTMERADIVATLEYAARLAADEIVLENQ